MDRSLSPLLETLALLFSREGEIFCLSGHWVGRSVYLTFAPQDRHPPVRRPRHATPRKPGRQEDAGWTLLLLRDVVVRCSEDTEPLSHAPSDAPRTSPNQPRARSANQTACKRSARRPASFQATVTNCLLAFLSLAFCARSSPFHGFIYFFVWLPFCRFEVYLRRGAGTPFQTTGRDRVTMDLVAMRHHEELRLNLSLSRNSLFAQSEFQCLAKLRSEESFVVGGLQ